RTEEGVGDLFPTEPGRTVGGGGGGYRAGHLGWTAGASLPADVAERELPAGIPNGGQAVAIRRAGPDAALVGKRAGWGSNQRRTPAGAGAGDGIVRREGGRSQGLRLGETDSASCHPNWLLARSPEEACVVLEEGSQDGGHQKGAGD